MINSKMVEIFWDDKNTKMYSVGFVVKETKNSIKIAATKNPNKYLDVTLINKNQIAKITPLRMCVE